MKTKLLVITAAVTSSLAVSANAEVLDVSTTQDAAYANFGQTGAEGRVFAELTTEGAGVAQTNYLRVYASTPDASYSYWSGTVPADAVSINGVASANIFVDTCAIQASHWSTGSCGLVDVTLTKYPHDFGWSGGGSSAYNYGDIIMQYTGSWSVHFSNATGALYGVSVDTENTPYSNAAIGRYTNVSVTVVQGN